MYEEKTSEREQARRELGRAVAQRDRRRPDAAQEGLIPSASDAEPMLAEMYRSITERIDLCERNIELHEQAMKFWGTERELCRSFLTDNQVGRDSRTIPMEEPVAGDGRGY